MKRSGTLYRWKHSDDLQDGDNATYFTVLVWLSLISCAIFPTLCERSKASFFFGCSLGQSSHILPLGHCKQKLQLPCLVSFSTKEHTYFAVFGSLVRGQNSLLIHTGALNDCVGTLLFSVNTQSDLHEELNPFPSVAAPTNLQNE